jgi:hypothetical protein
MVAGLDVDEVTSVFADFKSYHSNNFQISIDHYGSNGYIYNILKFINMTEERKKFYIECIKNSTSFAEV